MIKLIIAALAVAGLSLGSLVADEAASEAKTYVVQMTGVT